MLPTISNYGQYSSSNYGAHTLMVNVGGVRLWYSYSTLVAFADGNQFCVCENVWGTTTGKHINWIDGGRKSERLSHEDFMIAWRKCAEVHGL
jgi:hypothetical protein